MIKESKTIAKTKKTILIDTMEGVKTMLKELPYIDYEIGTQGGTLLELACAFTTDIEVVKYLLEQGADIHHTDHFGRNAFAYAWFNKTPYMDVFINQVLEQYWNKTHAK